MADTKLDPKAPLIVNCAEIEGFKDYTGRFVFKRPNNKDTIAIAVKNSRYTESTDLALGFSNMAWVLSTLSIVLTEKPKGLVFEELFDMEPVYELYDKYTKWVDSFRPVVPEQQEGASKE